MICLIGMGQLQQLVRAAGAASTARLVPLLLPLSELRTLGILQHLPSPVAPRNSGCSCKKVALKGLELGAEILSDFNSALMVPTQ